jgi:long-chain acyl-CoA synthetase
MPETFATIAQMFERNAANYGARAMFRTKRDGSWRDHSWSEIADATARLRGGLTAMGVRAGDRVAILSDNCPEWMIVDLAVQGLGAVVVPLFTTNGPEETAHVLNDSGARIIAVNGVDLCRKVIALSPQIADLATIIAIHPNAEPFAGGAGTPSIVTIESASAGDPAPIRDGTRDDLATIIYTSGTTGVSKGVMLTNGNLLTNSEDSVEALTLGENDMTLSFLPVAHSFERTAGHYSMMLGGGTIAYAEGLGQIAANLLEVEPTILLVVPRVLEVIYSRVMRQVESSPPLRRRIFQAAISAGSIAAEARDHGHPVPPHIAVAMAVFRRIVFARIRAIFGRRLRCMVSGSAPLPVEINRLLAAAEVPIVEGYGLTEAAPVVSCNLPGKNRVGTVGRPLRRVQLDIASDGELLVRGPNVMKGYFNRPDETREAIDANGWLHTGDIASIDAEGYIKITDRKKEIIVLSGGKNVSPAYVEGKLAQDKLILQACVFGDRRKHLAALLVPDFEAMADEIRAHNLEGKPHAEIADDAEIRKLFHQHIRAMNVQMSDVEAIVDFRLLPTPFTQENGELTPSLKVRRRQVYAHYQAMIEEMYGA